MTDQPTSLQDILAKVITRETHSGSVNRVRIQTEAEILAWIKAKAPTQEEPEPNRSDYEMGIHQGYEAGVTAFLEALEEKDVEN